MTLDCPPVQCTPIDNIVTKLHPVAPSSQEISDHESVGAVESSTLDCEAQNIISEGEMMRYTWRRSFNGLGSRKWVQCKPSVRVSPKKTS